MKPVRRDPSISIFTLILPRLEVFFLEEWIAYHRAIGVDEIHLYENGVISIDHREFGNGAPIAGPKWAKKPDAPYFMELDDDAIYRELHRIVDRHPNVHLVPWHYPLGNKGDPPGELPTKMRGYRHCISNNRSDWWVHIDPDEFLFAKRHGSLKDFLRAHPGYSTFHFGQRVFEQRKPGQPVLDNVKWGYECNIMKSLIQNRIRELRVHRSFAEGNLKVVPRQVLSIYHYRGRPDGAQPNMHAKYADRRFDRIDRSLSELWSRLKAKG